MKKLVFIDIDGTLLDENYHANSEDVRAIIRELQDEGVVFGLNSNRALVDMLPVAERFGIDGPLVSENGVFYATQKDQSTKLLVPATWERELADNKKAFEAELKSRLSKIYKDTFVWKVIDTVSFLSKPLGNALFSPGTVVFANNKYRKFTTSVHVFIQTSEGLEHIDPTTLDTLCDDMKPWCDARKMDVAKGYEFTNILAYSSRCSKRSAVEALRSKYKDVHFYAIGNENSDAEMIEGIGNFYAVANSMQTAKDKAAYVANATTTKGVSEILSLIKSGKL